MLLFHQVLIDSFHLFAGPAPVIRGSFLDCFDRYSGEDKTTVSDDPGMLAVLDSWGLVSRILFRTDGLIALTNAVKYVTLVFLTSN
jgi:hypothetical protein